MTPFISRMHSLLLGNVCTTFRHGRLVAHLQPTIDRAPLLRGVHSNAVASNTNGCRVECRSSSSPASHIPNHDGGCLAAITFVANHGGIKFECLGLRRLWVHGLLLCHVFYGLVDLLLFLACLCMAICWSCACVVKLLISSFVSDSYENLSY